MFFFKRRKKEKTLENKFDELNEGILNEKDRENPHKVEHYVIERLEQMIETTKEIEDEKAEYKVVTSYLNDIQTLEGLTEEEIKERTLLRQEYVAAVRMNLCAQLDYTYIVDEQGNKQKLQRKKGGPKQ